MFIPHRLPDSLYQIITDTGCVAELLQTSATNDKSAT